ncbi:hypothetical protein HK100_002585 [Physocladia obscura]|uniref:VOC domain-containing protein n=1 Tax=Physocladia obscura TaxID=109957 RepID=A0AAD5SXW1_9FUNG|nr:hypothetical protein HK100_002585 [Physocladia obscura]
MFLKKASGTLAERAAQAGAYVKMIAEECHTDLQSIPGFQLAWLRIRLDYTAVSVNVRKSAGLTFHHIEINSRSLAEALPFYTHFFGLLGLKLAYSSASIAEFEGEPKAPYICICQAKTGAEAPPFNRYAPGLNHLAFSLPTRAAVDAIRADLTSGELKRLGALELDVSEYPFAGGSSHYALFFLGAVDGFKFELVSSE